MDEYEEAYFFLLDHMRRTSETEKLLESIIREIFIGKSELLDEIYKCGYLPIHKIQEEKTGEREYEDDDYYSLIREESYRSEYIAFNREKRYRAVKITVEYDYTYCYQEGDSIPYKITTVNSISEEEIDQRTAVALFLAKLPVKNKLTVLHLFEETQLYKEGLSGYLTDPLVDIFATISSLPAKGLSSNYVKIIGNYLWFSTSADKLNSPKEEVNLLDTVVVESPLNLLSTITLKVGFISEKKQEVLKQIVPEIFNEPVKVSEVWNRLYNILLSL